MTTTIIQPLEVAMSYGDDRSVTLRASGDLFLAATAIEEGGEAQAGEVFLRLDVDGEGVDIVVTDPASGSDATAHLAVLGRAREAIDAAMTMLRRLNEA